MDFAMPYMIQASLVVFVVVVVVVVLIDVLATQHGLCHALHYYFPLSFYFAL